MRELFGCGLAHDRHHEGPSLDLDFFRKTEFVSFEGHPCSRLGSNDINSVYTARETAGLSNDILRELVKTFTCWGVTQPKLLNSW
ncbi:MAG: hypothetical protein Aurels2KO_13500 [Aureliella sp.]